MEKIEFNIHRFSARKDLLHFIEKHQGEWIYEAIGQNPRSWIDELNIINTMLTRNPLCGGTGLDLAPVDEKGTRKFGEKVLLYRGKNTRVRGLWIELDKPMYDNPLQNWTHYRLATNTTVMINKEFDWINPESLLPENFEPISSEPERTKGHAKRPVRVFDIDDMTVYSKGADTRLGFYYSGKGPLYRLTSIFDIQRTSSKREFEMTEDFTNLGIRVPEIVGMNESDIEPFLFLKSVNGKSPDKYITTHRGVIIDQDAEMLASMCLGGYRKQGFCDFDDKVFDGNNLHLIDVDECRDLYWVNAVDYRRALLNPNGSPELDKFRETQRNIFEASVRDAIYIYTNSLTPDRQSQERYINSFFGKLGWETPNEKRIDELLNFSKDYMTLDRYLSAMSDTD